jgi:hypothetical protein
MTASTIEDYTETVGKRLQASKTMSGSQPGDPVRAAEAMIALTQQPNPPPHLVLGKLGFEAVTKYLREQLQQIEAQRETAIGTDYPAP